MASRLILSALLLAVAASGTSAQVPMSVGISRPQEQATNVAARYSAPAFDAGGVREQPTKGAHQYTTTRTEYMQPNAVQTDVPALADISDTRYNSNSSYPSPPQNWERAILSNTGRSLSELELTNANTYNAASGTAYVNPGNGIVMPLYSRQNGRYYYYCTSKETRMKRDTICFDPAAGSYGNVFQEGEINLRSCCGMTNARLLVAIANYYKQQDMLLASDETSKHANSSQFFSFDGIIVYENDTIPGIITITQNAVSLERSTPYKGRKYYSSALKDPHLKSITVFKGVKTLHLVRLSPADKHLYRVVHRGKLSVYDRSYSFLTADNIGRNMVAEYGGQGVKVKTTRDLVQIANSVYQSNLPPETSTKDILRSLNLKDYHNR